MAQPDSPNAPVYYHLISALRALALINMLLFHFCYDVFIIFGLDAGWDRRPAVHVWQQYICLSFLFLSGISWHFGRHNLKKGLLLNFYGFVITAVTLIFLPSEAIWFGILNGIGCATWLACLADRFAGKLPAALGLALSLLLFVLFRHVSAGYLGIGDLVLVRLPDWLYQPGPMTALGFPHPGFRSSDYFPLLPWAFPLLAGYWFWKLVTPHEKCRTLFCQKIPILSALGKNTIWVYLLHQPILYGIAYLLCQVVGVSSFLP